MRQAPSRPGLGATVLIIGLLAACNDRPQPTAPSAPPSPPPAQAGPPGPAPPAVTLQRLTINGPTSILPGEPATYTVTAHFSDGSSRDVTREAQWSSSDESVLSVTAPGMAGGREMGEADIRTTFEGNPWGGLHVYVVPEGRFIARVGVSDGLIPVAPLFDARVEVVGGPAAGVSGLTDFYGSARLLGVPANVEIRVTKEGFQPLVRPAQFARNGSAVLVQLVPAVERPALTGTYQLRITSGACTGGSALPANVQTRTYTAGIYEPGGKPNVRLSGAAFVPRGCSSCSGSGGEGNGFTGQTQAVDTLFTLIAYEPDVEYGGGIHPSVAERLPDGTFYTVSGRAIVRPTPEGFDGTLDGKIEL